MKENNEEKQSSFSAVSFASSLRQKSTEVCFGQKGMNRTQFVEVFKTGPFSGKSWDVLGISFLLGLTTLCFRFFLGKQKATIPIMAMSGTQW